MNCMQEIEDGNDSTEFHWCDSYMIEFMMYHMETLHHIPVGDKTSMGKLGKLFVTCESTSRDKDIYSKNEIKYVVRFTGSRPNGLDSPGRQMVNNYLLENRIKILTVEIEDMQGSDIGKHLSPLYEKVMRKLKRGKNVLVHCHVGKSRSIALIIYILMRREHKKCIRENRPLLPINLLYSNTLKFIRGIRWYAYPNPSFRKQVMREVNKFRLTFLDTTPRVLPQGPICVILNPFGEIDTFFSYNGGGENSRSIALKNCHDMWVEKEMKTVSDNLELESEIELELRIEQKSDDEDNDEDSDEED